MAGLRARVPVLVQDPSVSGHEGIEPTENVDILDEDFFLDGPVARRIAVLDFDPDTGALSPGVPFTAPRPGSGLGRYQVDLSDLHSPQVMQASVFGTVLQTMRMFEDEHGLGRRIRWAFDGPQLLVVPRAGEWPNAFYERESRSLQFFYFDEGGSRVFTCLSRDIVAHETGHAILDGLAPDLYDAITPQSLALHEAIADIVALLMAFRSNRLRDAVLRQTGGSIKDSTAFNSIAEEFGRALDRTKRTGYLRNLLNEHTLDDVSGTEPHQLSEVLSGALYTVMVETHEQRWQSYQSGGLPRLEAAGRALRLASELFKRIVLRALDYLPPGEVSFADYGRALYAADRAAFPDHAQLRDRVAKEFTTRRIAETPQDISSPAPDVGRKLDVQASTLLDSDFAAYEFANANRTLLRVPDATPFRILPRAEVRKELMLGDGRTGQRHELLFKVSWDHVEPCDIPGLPRQRQVTAGTTLAMDYQTATVVALLTTDLSGTQARARDRMLRRLLDAELIELDELALGPDGLPRASVISGRSLDGVLRFAGTARTLHLTEP
jgi:hypothetical protein